MGTDQYVFLVITWGPENSQGEAFGPFPVQEDGAHLEEATTTARRWANDHPEWPEFSAQLFLTVAAGPGECR